MSNMIMEPLHMTGEVPPVKLYVNYLADHEQYKIYCYGGNVDDGGLNTTADLYCGDMRTREWHNYTDRLKNYNPLVGTAHLQQPIPTRKLPALLCPSTTFLVVGKRRLMFLFGGTDEHYEDSACLIAVDVIELCWWVVNNCGSVEGRMSGALVGVNKHPRNHLGTGTCLYLFGGVRTSQRPLVAIRSYSLLEYDATKGKGEWVVRDDPYPNCVPLLGIAGEAIAVENGKKILLMQGKDSWIIEKSVCNHLSEPSVLFDTEEGTFSVFETLDSQFPSGCYCYNLQTSTNVALEEQSPPEVNYTIDIPTSPNPHSILLCGWVPNHFLVRRGRYLPELWHFAPNEPVQRLNLQEQLFGLKHIPHFFVFVGTRLYVIGHHEHHPVTDICVAIALRTVIH